MIEKTNDGNSGGAIAAVKEYSSPQLRSLGDIRETTLGTSAGVGDSPTGYTPG